MASTWARPSVVKLLLQIFSATLCTYNWTWRALSFYDADYIFPALEEYHDLRDGCYFVNMTQCQPPFGEKYGI